MWVGICSFVGVINELGVIIKRHICYRFRIMRILLTICGLAIYLASYSQIEYKHTDFGFSKIPQKVIQYEYIMPDSVLTRITNFSFNQDGMLYLRVDKSSFTLPDTLIHEIRFYYEDKVPVKIILQGKGFSEGFAIKYIYTHDEKGKIQRIDCSGDNNNEFYTYKYDDQNLYSEQDYFKDSILVDKYRCYKNENGQIIKKIFNKYYTNYTTSVIDSFVYNNPKERFKFSFWDYNIDFKGKSYSKEYYDDNGNYIYSMIADRNPTNKYEYIYDSQRNWIRRRTITENGICLELIVRMIEY